MAYGFIGILFGMGCVMFEQWIAAGVLLAFSLISIIIFEFLPQEK
jgi:hypothetical protein